MKATFFAAVLACASAVAAAPLAKRSYTVRYDDQNSQVVYPPTDAGTWTHEQNQDQSVFWQGTFSYSNSDNAVYEFFLPDNASAFTIYSSRKDDRGRFLVNTVQHDGATTLIGSGDAWEQGQGGLGAPSQPLFYYQIPEGGLRSFQVANVAQDNRISGNAYLGIDFVEVVMN